MLVRGRGSGTILAMFQQSTVRASNPPGLVTPKNPYSQVAAVDGAGRLVTTAGQLGVDADGRLAGDFRGQVRQALANLSTALAAEGMRVEDILGLRHYVVSGQDLGAVNVERIAFLGEARPASTLVYVSGLANPKALYEVEAIAAR